MKDFLEYLRIIAVLARNDILQGLKNKNILVLFLSVGFIIVFYNALPSISGNARPAELFIYDADDSSLPARLEESSSFAVRSDFASEAELRERLALGDRPELGLVIPAGYDQQAESGTAPALRGIVAYWLSEKDVAELKEKAEEEIAAVGGADATVAIDGNVVYGPVDDEGAGTQAAMALIFSLTMIGISLVPHLMFDEKQARTLEVLLVSPASETQIAAGKMLAGLFYSGTVAVLGVIVNHSLIVHWGLFLAILTVYAMFCVSMGLILGTAMESRAQFSIWAWVIILPLFMPVILYLLRQVLPDAVGQLLPVIPSVTVYLTMRYIFAQPLSLGVPMLGMGWILVWTGVELWIVSWLLRRKDRAEEGKAGKAAARPQPKAEARPVPAAPAPRRADEGGAAAPDGLRASLRIVAAIAGKDLREAFRNRMIFSVLIGTVFLAVNGSLLPALINWGGGSSAVIYDEGNSALLRAAAGKIEGRLVAAESRGDMEEKVVQATGGWIGIVVPDDFDALAAGGAEIRLKAFAPHWTSEAKAAETAGHFAGEFGMAAGAPVTITVERNLYPAADSGGQPLLNLLTQLLMLVVVGFAIVPLLLVEEKESRTMEMLVVTPAGYTRILAGKTLAGMVYGLAVGAVIVLINLRMIVHWDVLILTLFLGTLFVVSVGLLIGVLADSPTGAAFWGSPLLLLSAVPILLEAFFTGVWPAWLTDLLSWFPTTVILRMFRLAIAGEIPAGAAWQSAAVLGASAAAVYALVVVVMRRKYSV